MSIPGCLQYLPQIAETLAILRRCQPHLPPEQPPEEAGILITHLMGYSPDRQIT